MWYEGSQKRGGKVNTALFDEQNSTKYYGTYLYSKLEDGGRAVFGFDECIIEEKMNWIMTSISIQKSGMVGTAALLLPSKFERRIAKNEGVNMINFFIIDKVYWRSYTMNKRG